MVQPVSTSYRGYDVWEIPPNGHGIVALMALNIMECMQFAAGHDSEEVVHRQLEAMKLAYSDGQQYIADPRSMKVTTEQMLSKVYAAYRAANIGQRAAKPQYGNPPAAVRFICVQRTAQAIWSVLFNLITAISVPGL